MSFVSFDFLAFYAIVLVVYVALPLRGQNLWLLAASAVFYGWEHPSWVALMAGAALVDFFAAIAMERWPAHKRAVLLGSLATNLGLLGAFKYAGFVALNLRWLGAPVEIPDVLLPAGISFYTFQTLSYTIDVYRGEIRARRSLVDYLLFVSFFPHLVAGPIQRAEQLLVQVERPRVLGWAQAWSGLQLALWGATKKLVVADNVAVYVDRVHGDPQLRGPVAYAAAFAFAVQILADFSGYTDMARGTARMMGVNLPENFKHPYLAATPSEFWRRWHLSFSTWIRDYLYIPLGGSQGSRARVALVTIATMAISGLWHGASWNFVLWGLFHGLLLVAYRGLPVERLPRIASVPVFFALTVLGWGLFRQQDGAALWWTLTHPGFGDVQAELIVIGVLGMVASAGGAVLVAGLLLERLLPRLGRWRLALEIAFLGLAPTLWMFWARSAPDAFIYFRF